MQTFIGLIRGINVGGNKKIKMDALKTLCESLALTDVKTLLQSGNVVFRSKSADEKRLTKKLEDALRDSGTDARVILRTPEELERAIAANPLKQESKDDPSHMVIMFLSGEPSGDAQKALRDSYSGPETMHFSGRELYIYYGDNMASSKLTNALIERKLGVSAGTARNWNTVTKLLALAQAL
jgi:uncharacterized protein (DUF1697 family)